MNRNSSLFSVNPVNLDISRTKFNRPFRNSTTFNVGKLVPFYLDEVLPGDTFDIETSAMIRFSSPLSIPLLDELFIDFYYFFVPMRLVWEHAKEFFGENNESAWIPSTKYSIPMLGAPAKTGDKIVGYKIGSAMNYMGIPANDGAGKDYRFAGFTSYDGSDFYYSALPMRGYCLIWNNFFRDQNLQDPVYVPLDDSSRRVECDNDFNPDSPPSDFDYTARAFEGMVCLPVNKTHDYFTSCLPGPQKGPAVGLNFQGTIPVLASDKSISYDFLVANGYNNEIKFFRRNDDGTQYIPSSRELNNAGVVTGKDTGNAYIFVGNDSASYASNGVGITGPQNLVADMALGTFGTINELREAFQVQKFFEKLARGGSRYKEIVKSMFNVDSADSRVQIPEYLGGNRKYLDISQVAQTSENGATPLGSLGAISQTPYNNKDFVKSFTEHGFIFGLCCVRYDHKYANGVDRMWRRLTLFDYYFPVFANLGEQAVMMSEIYSDSPYQGAMYDPTKDMNKLVFGYQERYAEYRYKRSYCSGHFATDQKQWTLTDFYANNPSLSDEWIREDRNNVDRSLQVSSQLTHQVYADIYVKNMCTRPMPLHSIPGLIDHH